MNVHRLWPSALLALLMSRAFAADAPGLAGLGWISGHWCGSTGDERIEEVWMSADGDVLPGLGRSLKGAATASYEYMRIVIEDGVPAFIAQPGGAAPTAFKRTAYGADWVRFENPAHDFPTRVEYRRKGEGLHAEIAGPGEDGREVVIPFEYVRCAT
jgi:hypothetical protein